MVSASPSRSERIQGLAVFAAAGFALGLGLIFALERVGAPDGFVEALGPVFAFVGLCVIGVTNRAPNLPDFLVAERAIPPLFAGLAFATTAAGLAASLLAESDVAGAPSWRGVAIGTAFAALIVAPRWRRENASSLSDVLATHFPAPPTKVIFTGVLLVIAMLTAVAGFDLATNTLVASIGSSRRVAQILVMFALAASVAPGGLKGLVWSDAACGGGALLILATGVVLALGKTPEPLAPVTSAWSLAVGAPGAVTLPAEIAFAFAAAFFFAFAPPAIGVGSAGQARGAGLIGLILLGIGLACAAVALPFVGALAGQSPTAKAFAAVAAWLPALALARAGVLGAARSVGIRLVTAYARLAVLSSRRIALIRLGALFAAALCPFAAHLRGFDEARALYFALAIGLAFATPSLALTWIPAASSRSALVALATSLAVAIARVAAQGAPSSGAELLIGAGLAGGVGMIVGVAAALFFPRRTRRPASPRSDPFIDVPLDL